MGAGEGVSAGASAASQATGSIFDILAQNRAEDLRKLALQQASQQPVLTLPGGDYNQLDYLGDYNPAAYATPESANAQTVADSPETRAIQMQALQNLIAQGNGAADASNAAGQFHALDSANQLANSREGAIRQEMERKGQGGTGVSALMRAQAAQMGANRAKSGTLDAVSQAALQKLAAMQGAVGAAGQVRGQDVGLNAQNANIINDFNKFNVAARNRVSQMNTEQANGAQLRNINTRQDISGKNTGIRNSNLDRKTNNAVLQNNSAVSRNNAIVQGLGGQAVQSQNSGNVYNQLGQQGGQLFNNIGSGIAASNQADRDNQQTEDPNEEWV
jgi:hypothetical protein